VRQQGAVQSKAESMMIMNDDDASDREVAFDNFDGDANEKAGDDNDFYRQEKLETKKML